MNSRVIHRALLADAGLCMVKAVLVALACNGKSFGEVIPRGDDGYMVGVNLVGLGFVLVLQVALKQPQGHR